MCEKIKTEEELGRINRINKEQGRKVTEEEGMEKQVFQEIDLEKIGRCPWQPRKRFEGPKFDEMVRSVSEKGVLEPILVRPLDPAEKENSEGFPTEGKKVSFQLVAGERRFRAAWSVAVQNGGSRKATIPAMVRPLTDDEAFDVMTIENLHREDLSELEEAENFKAYLERHGMEALGPLAERTGIHERYIRRRVRLLDLPPQVLKAWGAGEIAYGYLEQLNRLKDRKEILEIFKEILDGGSWKWQTVRELKDAIDDRSPLLEWARFDRTECLACAQNSEVQTELFETETMKAAHCLDPKCFKKKQNNWFQSNWKQTGFYKQHHTNGFRFDDDDVRPYSGGCHTWYAGGPAKKCRECPEFVTLLKVSGKSDHPFVCIGDGKCFEETKKKGQSGKDRKAQNGKEEQRDPDQPRVAWHGEFFRERFLEVQLPIRFEAIRPEDEPAVRLALFSLLDAEPGVEGWFVSKRGIKDPGNEELYPDDDEDDEYGPTEDLYGYTYVPREVIWKHIEGMIYGEVMDWLKRCSVQVLMHKASPAVRHLVGKHVGIDLAKEWRITKEYLDKKTVAEIHAIAEEWKLWERKEAQVFLFETLNKKRGTFRGCKKDELVRIILESGMDLAGVVPKEILAGDAHGSKEGAEDDAAD